MSDNINITCDEIAFPAHGQAVVEARAQAEGEFKILSVTAAASATPTEVFAGEVRYTGKVRFDCLVLAEGKIDCISAVAEFSDKIASPDITSGMKITLMPEVINVEAEKNGGTIKMVAVVDTTAVATVSHEYACCGNTADNVYTETQTIEHCALRAEQSETVYVTDSVSSKATEVLYVSSRAVVTDVTPKGDEVKVSGTVYSNIIVRTEGDMIASERVVTPFVKDVAAYGAAEDGIAYATAHIDSSTATSIVGENRLELAVTMGLDVLVMECRETEAATDVFCADNEIEVSSVTAECFKPERMITVTDTIDGQIPLAAERLAADNVLCVSGAFCTISDVSVDNGRVTVEGLVGGDIVYYNAEHNTSDTLAFRLPFSIPLAAHVDGSEVKATACVTDVSVRIRRESVFDIKAEVAFTLFAADRKQATFVTDVKLGEPIARPDASVIIHIAKPGETLWQAAKALCCSPDRVKEQNSASAPYSGGERLINFCNKA